ncbi:BfmA/BtgA family mobilization protein [Chondrinema litorale]|uniref:BfmA/BtgA family mobilization protein n=1 Tax=Chondrinema litorale TaxID=2994555 RepID=UPI002543D158|nr:BfmA/BtgA family mobilization protein [Chondrinema litorale]UZR99632.1 BfmA/BtgA family mobilization protein [Chondrinema litorale]
MSKLKAVPLEETTHSSLVKLCKDHNRKLKEFTAQMISYFEKTGIDPVDSEATDLKETIKLLRKENNRVIGFIKQQEKTKLNPVLDELARSTQEFRKKADQLDKVGELSKKITQLINKEVSDNRKHLEKAEVLFLNYLEKQRLVFGTGKIKQDNLQELNSTYLAYFKTLKDL